MDGRSFDEMNFNHADVTYSALFGLFELRS